MMTPAQMLEFHSERAARAASVLSNAQATGNFPVAALNVRQLFKHRVMEGLLTWRLGNGPRAALEKGVVEFMAGRQVLWEMDPGPNVDHELPLPNALLVAFLVDRKPEYPTGATERQRHDPYEWRLEWLLVSATRGKVDPAEVEDALGELAKRKRCKLAAASYRTYFEILGAERGNRLDEMVAGAEAHFAKRARDPFYSSCQTDGGGPDNDYSVDYRLAAVLKKVEYEGASIHRWRW